MEEVLQDLHDCCSSQWHFVATCILRPVIARLKFYRNCDRGFNPPCLSEYRTLDFDELENGQTLLNRDAVHL